MTESRWTQLLLGINALFLGYLIFVRGEISPGGQDLTKAVTLFDGQLKQGNYQGSYDLLMTSFRLAPTDSRLIGMVEKFVTASGKSADSEALDLADDVLARSANLVHFQKPSDVASVRKRLDALRPEAAAVEDIDTAIALATDKNLPIEDRFETIEQAKAILSGRQPNGASNDEGSDDSALDASVQANTKRLAEAEEAIQSEALSPVQTGIDNLGQKYADIVAAQSPTDGSKQDPFTADSYIALDQNLSDLEQSAVPLVLDLDGLSTLFAQLPNGTESPGTSDFQKVRTSLDELVAKIRSRRIFHYNQYVLQRIEEISSKDDDAVDSLVGLLSHEDWLMDFVSERFNEKWNATMDKLGLGKKLDAMTKRVFHSLKTQR